MTPKKLLFWDTTKSNETHKLEEELMTTRIREVETLTELKELRLKVSFNLYYYYNSYIQVYIKTKHKI